MPGILITIYMWYVIWALSTKEHELKNRIEVLVPKELYRNIWIPMKEELRKYHGEEILKQVKLFPGYVFIDTDEPEMIHRALYREEDFIKFLQTDMGYSPLSREEEEIIRHFTGESGIAGVSLGVVSGGVLTIFDGPLKGLEEKVVKIDRHKKKAWVKFDKLLGEERVLTFAINIVSKD